MGQFCFFKWYFEKKWVGRAMGNETFIGMALGSISEVGLKRRMFNS